MKRVRMLFVAGTLLVPVAVRASIPTLHSPLAGDFLARHVNLDYNRTWCFEKCPPDPNGVCKIHDGRDVQASVGEYVYAVEAGTVKAKVFSTTWRYCITIQHSGYTSVSWHIEPIVNVNDPIVRGQPIGTIANLGLNTHFHLGIRNGTYNNTANSGALPTTPCGGYPEFPENFVDPGSLNYDGSSTYRCAPAGNTYRISGHPGDVFNNLYVKYKNIGTATWNKSGGLGDPNYVELKTCSYQGIVTNSWFTPYNWIAPQRVTTCDEATVPPSTPTVEHDATFTFSAQIPTNATTTIQDRQVWFRPAHGDVPLEDWGGVNILVQVLAPTNPSNVSVSPLGCSVTNSFSFSWSPSNAGASGIREYHWNVNGVGDNTTTATSVPAGAYAPAIGTYTLSVRAVDNAGNSSGTASVNFCYQPPTGPCGPPMQVPPCSAPPQVVAELERALLDARMIGADLTFRQWQDVGQPAEGLLEPQRLYRIGFEYRSVASTNLRLVLGTLDRSQGPGQVLGEVNLVPAIERWHPFWSAPFTVTTNHLKNLKNLRFEVDRATISGVEIRKVRIWSPIAEAEQGGSTH